MDLNAHPSASEGVRTGDVDGDGDNNALTLARKSLLDAEAELKVAEAQAIRVSLHLRERELKLKEDIFAASLDALLPELGATSSELLWEDKG